ncbi:MAG: hypothetical protein PWP31_1110 [Clostridia bacterium]|nr:hypothetical protein [Clostridia bacterium]
MVKVLLVDDERLLVNGLKPSLEVEGYDVVVPLILSLWSFILIVINMFVLSTA